MKIKLTEKEKQWIDSEIKDIRNYLNSPGACRRIFKVTRIRWYHKILTWIERKT